MSSVKKIALIEPVGGHGGMEFYDYGLAQGLAKNGVEVHFFTSEETTILKLDNVHTHLCYKNVWSAANKVRKLLNYIKGLKKAIKTCTSHNINIVHVQFFELNRLNLFVLKRLKRAGFKIVLTLHDVSSFHGKSSTSSADKAIRLVDEIIVHNPSSQKSLNSTFDNIESAIIPHGNYLNFYPKVEPISITSEEPLKLLFFGQIKEVKGLEVLIDAMEILKNSGSKFHLSIIGRPWHTSEQYYNDLIEGKELSALISTRFEYVPNDEIPSIYESHDLVVLPYRKIYQSGVLLLSMSLGRPCLTSNLQAFEEIIEDGTNGFLFESESASSLASKLEHINNNKHLLSPLTEKANQLLTEKFDWNTIAESTIEIYQGIK